MYKELFNFGKISSLIKNKYGNFVIQKAIKTMSSEERHTLRDDLSKKVNVTSSKEKARMNALLEIL
jgi:hypothetical protein